MRGACTLPSGWLAALAIVLAAGTTNAGEKSDSKVKVSATASKPVDGKQVVSLAVVVEEGWYIYANPVKSADFDANKTEVRLWAGKKEVPARVVYPEGKLKKDGKFSYMIYQGKVTIEARFKRPAGSEPLVAEVRVSSCSLEGICLLPGSVQVKVP